MDGHTSYSLYSGGSVVNLAIELNGQPPLQVYVKPCKEYHITLRSVSYTHLKETFLKRATVVKTLRNALDEAGYTEVETPILQSIAGGDVYKRQDKGQYSHL